MGFRSNKEGFDNNLYFVSVLTSHYLGKQNQNVSHSLKRRSIQSKNIILTSRKNFEFSKI